MEPHELSNSATSLDDASLLVAALDRRRGEQGGAELELALEGWLNEGERAREVELWTAALRPWDTASTPSPDAVRQRAERIIAGASEKPRLGRRPVSRDRWPRWLGLAGIAACVLGGVMLYPAWQHHDNGASVNQEIVEHVTTPGQRATIPLPDGSTVLLNAASRVRYPKNFKSSRMVELEGEALFTVSSHTGQPFTVRAGGVATKVLGTVFSVTRYPEDTATAVIVAQGKVMLADAVLSSGQGGMTSSTGQQVVVRRQVDLGDAMAWTTGQLALSYVPFGEAKAKLERWYGIDIVLADASLAKKPVRIVLQQETASQAMALIAKTLDATVAWDGRRVVVSPIL